MEDINHIIDHTVDLWGEFSGQRIFMTGGTGFVGSWLLESFMHANEKFGLNATVTVLTRDPDAFTQKAPHLALNSCIILQQGELQSFNFPAGSFSHIIHAGADTSHELYDLDPLLAFDTIVEGTRRVLEFSRYGKAKKVLFVSSGAVYGKQPHNLAHMSEEYSGGPLLTDHYATYSESKRAAELLCMLYARHCGFEVKIARCFALIGPYMPLDKHFAIGNFIRDCLRGCPVQVNGDGSPYRSYLYAADLAIWLWTIMCNGESCRPYNVGSDIGLPIYEVAKTVAGSVDPHVSVIVAKQQSTKIPAERFVPSIVRARSELELDVLIELPEAVKRTMRWNSQKDSAQ